MTRPRPDWVPPAREGVSASRVAVPSAGAPPLLIDYLTRRLAAAADWPARMARGDVLDAAGRPLGPDAPTVPGMVVWYWRSLPPEPRVPFELCLLHQDAHLVAVDKPHFLPVNPGGRYLQETVLVRLRRMLGLQDLSPLHRLDRETAGVLLFAVRPQDRHAYQSLFARRAVDKTYEAIAGWRPDHAWPMDVRSRLVEPQDEGFMQMRTVAGEPNAETRIELIERLPGGRARYRLLPRTGRKHQLRVQMNDLGLPIVGDRIYPRLLPHPADDALPDWHAPLQLLARAIAFDDPVTGQARHFTSDRRLEAGEPAAGGERQG